jgi:DNA-binding beta-propeller fold protein YncE
VTRIDPRTLQPDPPISVGRHPSWVTVGAERIWTTSARSGGVSRIDPRLPETGAETFLSGETTRGIAATDGSVWLSHGSNLVSEIDSLTGGVLRRREVGRIPVGLTVAKGKLWVANSQADSVSRIDLRSGSAVGSPIRVGDKPWAVAFGEGAIWVANSGDHTVTRLDPDTGKRIGNPIRVGREPVAVTVAEGAVWVTNNDADTVSRLVP